MTFEVDNTTRLLLEELQGSMEKTISDVGERQDEVKSILESMKQGLLETASAQELAGVKGDVDSSRDSIEKALGDVQGSLTQVEESLKDVTDKAMFKELEEQVVKYHRFVTEFKKQLLKVNTDILRKQTVSSEELLTVLTAISQAIMLEEKKFEEEMWTAQKNSDELKAAIEGCAVRKDIAEAVQSLQKNIYVFTNKLQANYTGRVLAKLEELSGKMDAYDAALSKFKDDARERSDSMALKIDDISMVEGRNSKILESVSEYLALPGYKRFFKGMKIDNADSSDGA